MTDALKIINRDETKKHLHFSEQIKHLYKGNPHNQNSVTAWQLLMPVKTYTQNPDFLLQRTGELLTSHN